MVGLGKQLFKTDKYLAGKTMKETLTDVEKNNVEIHRQNESKKLEAEAFYRISVIIASEWQEYAMTEGYHLTHSVFIDGFDFNSRLERLDAKHGLNGQLKNVSPKLFVMAIKRTLDAASSYTNNIYDLNS